MSAERRWVALLVAGALAGGPVPAVAQERPPDGVRDLWREYPLEQPRTTPAPVTGSADSSSAPSATARAPAASSGDDGGPPVLAPLAVVALVIAGVLLFHAVRRRELVSRRTTGRARW